MDKSAIRHAATVILLRDPETAPKVLMGQRGANAAFMPNKFVFPGGAMDPGDTEIALAADLPEPCTTRIHSDSENGVAHGLFVAAIRELWEETGLILGTVAPWPGDVPPDWQPFADMGFVPNPNSLKFVFRAITPPGRPRRFDARFFLTNADHLMGNPDDFSHASDELSHLQWIPLDEVRNFSLPFITEVVLAEVAASLPDLNAPASVPFFDNRTPDSIFRRIGV